MAAQGPVNEAFQEALDALHQKLVFVSQSTMAQVRRLQALCIYPPCSPLYLAAPSCCAHR